MPEVETSFKEPKQPKDIPAKTRRLVHERSGGMCEMRVPGICTGRAVQIDHIKNKSQGLDHSLDNLQHGCLACHKFKTENPDAAHELGLYKHAWE
jgi:hypothetical protein